jgi:hypothetical protein
VVVSAVVAAPVVIAAVSGSARPDRIDVPGTTVRHLGVGTYVVMPLTSTSEVSEPLRGTVGDGTPITGIEVTGPDGAVIEMRSHRGEAINTDDDHYESVARFDIDTAADYTISSRSSTATSMLVTRDLLDRYASVLLVVGVCAVVSLIAGVVWLVALVRDSGRRRTHQHLPPPPGGWSSGSVEA